MNPGPLYWESKVLAIREVPRSPQNWLLKWDLDKWCFDLVWPIFTASFSGHLLSFPRETFLLVSGLFKPTCLAPWGFSGGVRNEPLGRHKTGSGLSTLASLSSLIHLAFPCWSEFTHCPLCALDWGCFLCAVNFFSRPHASIGTIISISLLSDLWMCSAWRWRSLTPEDPLDYWFNISLVTSS